MIVPLSLASLVTGVVQSLGTTWGLFRHYRVTIKLLLTVLSTVVLLVHMRPISHVAGIAIARPLATGDLRAVRVQLTVDAGAALLVLCVTTTLSVLKPRGLTAYGRRKRPERRAMMPTSTIVDAALNDPIARTTVSSRRGS